MFYGGNAYTTRLYLAFLVDIDYYLRYARCS